ncbi:NAD-dependent protein deacetylase hst2, partial [Diplonema papillatum]
TATGIPLGDAHLPPPEAKPGDSPDLKDKGSGNPTDPQTPPAAAAAADACKPGAALKEPGSPPLPASPAAVGEGRSPAASAAAAAAAAGVNPFAPAEAAAKQARRFLFVYGSLRPDDSAGLEPTHPLFKSADFMPSTLKGVRLYHDKRPAIRLPDPGASPNDEVVGYLVRFKDDATYDEKIQELDKREGCPVLSRRGLVWVHPRDGGDRVAAEVYYSEHVACHTVVPFGDWERRREWRALPELRGLIKPGIVFFDEELPEEFAPQQIESDLGNADALIVVGTSLRVTPFCWLPQIVSSTCPRLLLNLNATEVGQKAGFTLGWQSWRDVAYDGDCQAAVTQLAAFLGWEQELLELKAKGDERMRALWKEQELTTLTIGRPTSPSLDSIDGADVDSILSVSDERSSASDDEEEANRLQAT